MLGDWNKAVFQLFEDKLLLIKNLLHLLEIEKAQFSILNSCKSISKPVQPDSQTPTREKVSFVPN
jgi:hypothetical protein